MPRLILSLAIPTIISMMITAVYNLADTYFVSQIGTSAAGACGIVFSLMAIIQAVGFTIGMGCGSNISRLLGAQQYDRATEIASSGFLLALICGGLLIGVGIPLIDPLMGLLGATPTILPFAREYASYILYAAPLMCASFVLNNVLRSQGRAVLSMIGLATGGLLNIALDPLLIFGFNLGIAGAALATLISQCISFFLLLLMFLRGKSTVRLQAKMVSRDAATYWLILKTGFPSFCRQGLASIATAALNLSAGPYGDEAIAAMSIVGRLFMFVLSAVVGLGQGFQPVMGYSYGAALYERVRKAFFFTLKISTALLIVVAVAGFCLAPQIMTLFRATDVQVIETGALAIQLQCLVLPLNALICLTNMTFQVIGKSWQATLISSARQGLFFLPLILLLPMAFGLFGVQITQPLADMCSALLCVPFVWIFFRHLRKNNQNG